MSAVEPIVTDPAPAAPQGKDPAPSPIAPQDPPAGAAPPADPATDPAQQGDPAAEPAKNWYADILGEGDDDLAKIAGRYGDPKSVIKALGDTQKALRDSGRIKVPGENATDEERAEFRQQMGIPDAPDGYEITVQKPADIEVGEADQAFIDKTISKLHERGDFLSTPDAANLVHEVAYDMIAERDAQLSAAAEMQREQSEQELRTEWGDQYDINMRFVNAAVSAHFGKDWSEIAEIQMADGTRLGDSAVFIRGMMNAGRATTEDMAYLRAASGKSDLNASSIDERIDTIMGWYKAGDPASMQKYQAAQSELLELRARRERISGAA